MLTNSVNERKFIYSVCKTTGDISCGEVFEIIRIANEWDVRFGYHTPIPRTKIICCGDLNANQKLFRTANGQYYFGIADGWGAKDGILYGMCIGFFYDFGHPMTFEAILAECDAKYSPNTMSGSMKERQRRSTMSDLKPIIQRLMENPGGDE